MIKSMGLTCGILFQLLGKDFLSLDAKLPDVKELWAHRGRTGDIVGQPGNGKKAEQRHGEMERKLGPAAPGL